MHEQKGLDHVRLWPYPHTYHQSMTVQEGRLKVVIVGAGLAGALAGRVLRERHDVTIYERSSNPAEVGAAINIGPNGVRILDTLHFDRVKAGSLPVQATKVYDKTGKLTLDKQVSYTEKYGADWLFHHRADLRAEFLRLATAETNTSSIPGQPATVCFGQEVVKVDVESGRVTLAGGEVVEADLVIGMRLTQVIHGSRLTIVAGADGIKSVLRPHVVGEAAFQTARPSGLSAFRFTIPASYIEQQIGQLPEILDSTKPVCLSMIFSFDGTMRSIVMYPCRRFELLNFVCIAQDKILKTATTESWTAAGDRDEMLGIFQDFPPWVLDYLK